MALGKSLVRRATKSTPLARALMAAEVAVIAGRHLGRLSGAERRRLLELLAIAARRRGHLSVRERRDLTILTAKLEPRLLLGTAVRRVSPVPIPARLLYGRRGSAARRASRARD
ncbi:MAG TPA: hypothetical protein VHT27_07105 [Solirubrobacteraceae bacterium]|jgi:hypothetical protein|nr:hypothetical protein [Solirubrobacteraceae bacterium]